MNAAVDPTDRYDLFQTNVQNNNNKYYLIQLLEEDAAKRYSVWMRWGRVGFRVRKSCLLSEYFLCEILNCRDSTVSSVVDPT